MKLSVLCAGIARPHAGWVAIDELALLLTDYFGAELLSPTPASPPWWQRWRGQDRDYHQPVQTSGGDVLIVVARGPSDLGMIHAIPDVRRKFSRIHAWVTDSYFQAGFGRSTAHYDAITVTAPEDADFVRETFGITVHPLYQGTDALRWAPRQPHARDIDLIAFGRTPPSYHQAFAEHFHQPDSPHLYLHSPLGHLSGSEVHRERGMLLKLLQRTRISLAFHLYVEPQGNRPRSMMVTSRWLESLAAGCIVAGKRPVSRMADDLLSWEGATVELADDPRHATEELLHLLARNDTLEEQRRRNIHQSLLHHDWRHRVAQLAEWFGLPPSERLAMDLAKLQELAEQWR